jgi:hypothetical protein
MVLYGHAPIIANEIDTTFLNLPWRKIPVRRMADIGLLNRLPVNEKPSVEKLHPFALHCNNALQEHYLIAGKTQCDDVMPFGRGKEVGDLPAEIDTSVAIGWLHAVSPDKDGGAEMTEEEI